MCYADNLKTSNEFDKYNNIKVLRIYKYSAHSFHKS